MINRSTKLTALLLTAASIASMTPAMAVEKLGNREGTIKEAVAFEGGKYIYQGYRTEDDDTGIWYNKGTEKDIFVEDLEEYEINSQHAKYGTKYAYVTEDGNKDDYLVDLSTGKVVDDESASEKMGTAEAKLVSNLKRTDRYENVTEASNINIVSMFNNQFGDIWYQYTTTGTDVSLKETTGAAIAAGSTESFGVNGVFTGFVNENGKYIDASYLANLRIYNLRKDKATVIEKFGKDYKDEALRVDLKAVKPLAQDKDYIYALSTVEVRYYIDHGNKQYVFGDNAVKGTDYKTVTQYFIQKISKAQGDKQDGAYIPKSVVSYQVDAEDLYVDEDDNTVDASDAIFEPGAEFAVKDGNLYVTYRNPNDSNKIKVAKLKFGKAKLDVNASADEIYQVHQKEKI